MATKEDIDKFLDGVHQYESQDRLKGYEGGFKRCLVAFAWYYIMRDKHAYSSSQGILSGLIENAEVSRRSNTMLYEMYNRAVDLYNRSAWYIEDNLKDTDVFKYRHFTPKEYKTWT